MEHMGNWLELRILGNELGMVQESLSLLSPVTIEQSLFQNFNILAGKRLVIFKNSTIG